IEGAAVFQEHRAATKLCYHVTCTAAWETKAAEVSGWGDQGEITLKLERDLSGIWVWNGQQVPEFKGLIDVDLGFTPATNTIAIRRLNLAEGQSVETIAAWVDTDDWSLKPLLQEYHRLSKNHYLYRSPNHNYEAVLTVNDAGLVLEYPDLWTTKVEVT
ncbi:MAG: putative glycolipid-binding domain-containing protein, partial [Alphaproteobacteria bacterium]|nr:putative glycolipid-binding domain-containing protein [Alphaproteobacteria bacterium]